MRVRLELAFTLSQGEATQHAGHGRGLQIVLYDCQASTLDRSNGGLSITNYPHRPFFSLILPPSQFSRIDAMDEWGAAALTYSRQIVSCISIHARLGSSYHRKIYLSLSFLCARSSEPVQ